MTDLGSLLNPPTGLTITTILFVAFVLGLLHGFTPDEHTWPITFSYSIGSYSTRGGMKSGFTFSLGFMIQRAILTTLGFLGLAAIYETYNLDGPVYIVVGLAMFIAGSYVLKGRYLHIPVDVLFKGRRHHSAGAERLLLDESEGGDATRPVPLRMAAVHGFIAGWGVGAYATIITFVLAPQVPGLIYAPLPGLLFGFGTMCMQIIVGSIFANIMRVKHLTIDQIKVVGKLTAGRTLYYGGMVFAAIGALIAAFPIVDDIAIGTGNPIPNLDSIGISTVLVIGVVGVIGMSSMYKGYVQVVKVGRESKVPLGRTENLAT
jgi:hypothetical protein